MPRHKQLSNEEKTELVQEAQEKLSEVIELLEAADLGPNTEAYIIDHLKIICSANHGFLSRDKNLDDVLESLEGEQEEEDEQDESETPSVSTNAPGFTYQ